MFANRPRLAGTLVGLAVTVISAVALHQVEFFRIFELRLLDVRMRQCNDLTAASPIVHIDIDDGSLERIGRWPWHRDTTADVIRVLNELGAASILVDLLFSEPEPDYYDDPDSGLSGTAAGAKYGERSEANHVYPDLELAGAIRDAGNVILAVQLETIAPGGSEPLSGALLRLRTDNPAISAADAMDALGLANTFENRARVHQELLRLRVREALLSDFTMGEQALAGRLNVPVEQVAQVIAGVKRRVATELVQRHLKENGSLSIEDVKAAILGEARHRLTADARDVEAAFDRVRGLMALERSMHRDAGRLAGAFSSATTAVPPFHLLANAAKKIAAVTFTPDVDGSVRRIPVLVKYGDRLVEHMGFAAAAEILGLDVGAAEMPNARRLVVPFKSGDRPPVELSLDGQGNLIIHWTKTAAKWRGGADFPHITAAKVWTLADARREIRHNERLLGHRLGEVMAAVRGTTRVTRGDGSETVQHLDEDYRRRVNQRLVLEQEIHLAELAGRGNDAETAARRETARQLREAIEREHAALGDEIELNLRELDEAYPPEERAEDAEYQAALARFDRARKILREELPEIQRQNDALRARIEQTRAELAPLIRGKHVFLGYAATASGDIVATPISPQTNGVMCHAQVLNSILQNRFITPAPEWMAVALCVVLGIVTGYVTATRQPAFALTMAAVLMTSFALVNFYALFQKAGVYFAALGCIATIFLVWAFVTLFRQLTAERDKRLFRKQLSQYTSPAIAAKIAESPEAARAFKAVQTRDMTCMFSDLKGFTTISEQEDAEVVQHVLNVYLERMSETIWAHRGLINKFMGDGIMAIFNPSVDPLSTHGHAACEAALHAMQALEELKRERLAQGDAPVFARLHMRLGIASGLCKNGDFGAELKADYTVIGDVVNLAARLEPANKVFGTSVLVSGPLYERVKDAYEFRYLAELQVKGKARTVPVYEILGRRGEVPEETLAYARRFEAGVALYKQRKWDECLVHFTRILAQRPDDAGASRYIEACQELKTFPPGEDWAGALELKEK